MTEEGDDIARRDYDLVNAFVDREVERAAGLLEDARVRRWKQWGDVALRFALALAVVGLAIALALWLLRHPRWGRAEGVGAVSEARVQVSGDSQDDAQSGALAVSGGRGASSVRGAATRANEAAPERAVEIEAEIARVEYEIESLERESRLGWSEFALSDGGDGAGELAGDRPGGEVGQPQRATTGSSGPSSSAGAEDEDALESGLPAGENTSRLERLEGARPEERVGGGELANQTGEAEDRWVAEGEVSGPDGLRGAPSPADGSTQTLSLGDGEGRGVGAGASRADGSGNAGEERTGDGGLSLGASTRDEGPRVAESVGTAEKDRAESQLKTLRERKSRLENQLRETEARLAESKKVQDALLERLEKEIESGQAGVAADSRGRITVQLGEDVLFPAGSAELDDDGLERLLGVLEDLRRSPFRIRVEGHTDSVPIRGELAKRYPTNWELAGARAARVVRIFENAGVDRSRLEAASMGDTKPLASNQSAEGRAQNRRIEIHLVRPGQSGAN